MTSTTDMNIILGQGTAIKEVHNVKKQNLEINQQFVAQKTEDKRKEDKSKVQEFETIDKIEIKEEAEKKGKKSQKDNKKDTDKEDPEEEFNLSEGNLINITV